MTSYRAHNNTTAVLRYTQHSLRASITAFAYIQYTMHYYFMYIYSIHRLQGERAPPKASVIKHQVYITGTVVAVRWQRFRSFHQHNSMVALNPSPNGVATSRAC